MKNNKSDILSVIIHLFLQAFFVKDLSQIQYEQFKYSLEATMAQAKVEFTSPATITISGRTSKQTVSNFIITSDVCFAWVPLQHQENNLVWEI